MAEIPFWDIPVGYEGDVYLDNPWDTITIGGRQMPGKCVSCKCKPSRKMDTKDEPGTNSRNPTFHGYKGSPVNITIAVWTPEQWEILQKEMKILWPPGAKQNPQALDIYHPTTALYSIRSILIIDVDEPKDEPSIRGAKSINISALEFLPVKASAQKKSATVTPISSRAVSSKLTGDTTTPANPLPGVNYTPDNQQSLPSDDPLYSAP